MRGLDVEDHLESGEEVEDHVEVGTSEVYVTNRRLLAFTPQGSGRRFRAVDRPNVTDVATVTRSDRGQLLNAGAALLVVGLLVGAGLTIETDGVFGGLTTGPGARAIGVGGFIGQINRWVGMVDNALVYGGLALLVLVAYYVLKYFRSRHRVVAIDVAGGRDVDLPADELPAARDRVRDIREALDLPHEPAGPARDDEQRPIWE